MAWKCISYLCIALATASAYRQIRYSGLIYQEDDPPPKPMIHRRIDTRDFTFDNTPDRAENPRYYLFRSNCQTLQEPRNRKMSLRVGNPLTKANAVKRDNPLSSGSVMFPGLLSRSSIFVPEIPMECDNHIGICEQIPNYPQQYVDDLLFKIPEVKYRFNLDVETPDIAQRRESEVNEKEMCPSIIKVIYPKAARNSQGKWVLIVSRDGKPVQGFKAVVCENIDKKCNEVKSVGSGYNATCQQKTTDRSMWALDHNGEMVMETIPMPSCCACCLSN